MRPQLKRHGRQPGPRGSPQSQTTELFQPTMEQGSPHLRRYGTSRSHPPGPGWEPIRKVAGPVQAVGDRDNMPLALLGWVAGCTAIWAALPLKDGSVLLGTGNEGKLVSVQGGKTSVVAETPAR